MRGRLLSLIALAVLCIPATVSHADILHLKNGEEIEGTVVKEDANSVVIEFEYGSMTFSRSEIREIEKKPLPVPDKLPVAAVDKPEEEGVIIYKGKSYSKERFKSIVIKKGLVYYKGQWVTGHEKLGMELEGEKEKFHLKKIVEYASPAVVSIKVDDSRLGSGTMINSNGLFITNWHVVKDAKKIRVKLFGEDTEHSARVMSHNDMYDLALVSIGGADRPYLKLADSGSIAVGDNVIAMGNPFGLATSVTTGVASSVRKLEDFPGANTLNLSTAQKKFLFIQTDAAINPGNSGGPLLNSEGKIAGINSFGISKKVAEGLNFALHADEIKKVYSNYFE